MQVLAQPGGVAWNVFDDTLLALGRTFPDFVAAEAAGAVRPAADAAALAALIGCDAATLAATLAGTRLQPPYCAIKVTGALFHTQGGLDIDAQCRVLRDDGTPLPNLLAAGGAARGVSGNAVWGYLSGNGLLSAVAGGFIAAHTAAQLLAGGATMNDLHALARRLAEARVLLAPGVYDALTALIAEQAGFEALYLSGASIAYTRLGRSDIGLTTFSEVEDVLARITERVRVPVIVDADTGFGNALNVQRTVRGFERAGAAMIQLEDQTFPKRCGHLDGKSGGAGGRDAGQAARRARCARRSPTR